MPRRYIPALIILFVLVGSTIYAFNEESSYIKDMAVAEGVVVALGSKSTSSSTINGSKTTTNTQAIVEFESNNSTFRVEGRAMGYPNWEIGQIIEVYYSEENPNMARIKRWDEIYFFTIISAFFLSCGLLFGLVNFVVYKVRGKPLS